ncbi:hypothetical protein DI53_0999 [Sphingobacterium deserti]|uniref:Uncharacterized protein n=1 Tax=Sphingobacterium deserti TaxID=1229276 RepID=A0A0B8T4W9_9SPHI|nr:hypothetical protein DI53_0999 [Sphingobacterium deserti]
MRLYEVNMSKQSLTDISLSKIRLIALFKGWDDIAGNTIYDMCL